MQDPKPRRVTWAKNSDTCWLPVDYGGLQANVSDRTACTPPLFWPAKPWWTGRGAFLDPRIPQTLPYLQCQELVTENGIFWREGASRLRVALTSQKCADCEDLSMGLIPEDDDESAALHNHIGTRPSRDSEPFGESQLWYCAGVPHVCHGRFQRKASMLYDFDFGAMNYDCSDQTVSLRSGLSFSSPSGASPWKGLRSFRGPHKVPLWLLSADRDSAIEKRI